MLLELLFAAFIRYVCDRCMRATFRSSGSRWVSTEVRGVAPLIPLSMFLDCVLPGALSQALVKIPFHKLDDSGPAEYVSVQTGTTCSFQFVSQTSQGAAGEITGQLIG